MLKEISAVALYSVTLLAFANGNHEQNSHHEDKTQPIVENTYIEYKDFSEAIAAQAALSSIPALSHRGSKHKHTGVSFSTGYYDDSSALGVAIQKQCDSISWKINSAFSGGESVHGIGMTISF